MRHGLSFFLKEQTVVGYWAVPIHISVLTDPLNISNMCIADLISWEFYIDGLSLG